MSTIKFVEDVSLHSLNSSYLDEYPENHYVSKTISLYSFLLDRILKLVVPAFALGLALVRPIEPD